jgi:gamma-glutamyltranspeptidase / glutathione hydrolase
MRLPFQLPELARLSTVAIAMGRQDMTGIAANGTDWRARTATRFNCEKQPAIGTRGMVVTNNPLASAAGAEMLAAGGNAVDAAIAAFFTLTVTEPMMVGILGGGLAHIRLADGTHTVIDGQSTAPLATGPTTYTPDPNAAPGTMDAVGRANSLGPSAVAAPGNLKAWCETLARFGTFPLADVMEPAIRHAARGFRITPYLYECAADAAGDLARDAEIARLYLPDDAPIAPGTRLVTGDYAETLRSIARHGPDLLYGGELGRRYTDHMASHGGHLAMADLTGYRTIERAPLRGTYRGFEITGPPPPSSGPLHIIQMLNILEGYDVAQMGFGTPDTLHLLAEVLKIAFADRTAATGDPAFVKVPVEQLLSKDYAAERRALIDLARARAWTAGVPAHQSPHTTHLTVADGMGNIVASTQTINSTFGARYVVPGTGMIPNNYMHVFTPYPGRASSVAPGKRVTSSMAPVIALRDGKPAFALGLPGGLRIFGSVLQALLNLIDHGMSVQEAVEAPRLWTQGFGVEIERGFGADAAQALRDRGHEVAVMPHVAGGMCAIRFDDAQLTGAACWRADGTAIGLGGGLAREGVRFWPDKARG